MRGWPIVAAAIVALAAGCGGGSSTPGVCRRDDLTGGCTCVAATPQDGGFDQCAPRAAYEFCCATPYYPETGSCACRPYRCWKSDSACRCTSLIAQLPDLDGGWLAVDECPSYGSVSGDCCAAGFTCDCQYRTGDTCPDGNAPGNSCGVIGGQQCGSVRPLAVPSCTFAE
jgi:hypothetical protein